MERRRNRTVFRIAHLSDLHFRRKPTDSSWQVWKALKCHLLEVVRPHLVLITGDLADSPGSQVYEAAGREISSLDACLRSLYPKPDQNRVWVCPGNHDRHWRGNSFFSQGRSHFDCERELAERFPVIRKVADEPRHVDLTDGHNRWRIRLAALDSSRHARFTAQAFLPQSEIDLLGGLRDPDNADPPRLTIMLFHHHLLPLPQTEPKRQRPRFKAVNWAGAVNPGRILEALAASQVDLVLHGHMHKANQAGYRSYDDGSSHVAMVAAGSATGQETLQGCCPERARFNLIELRADRSVWSREVSGGRAPGGHVIWNAAPHATELLDATQLRQNFYLRRRRIELVEEERRRKLAAPDADPRPRVPTRPTSIIKHVNFLSSRDAVISEIRTNWKIAGGGFSVPVQSDTGDPAEPTVIGDVAWPPGQQIHVGGFERTPGAGPGTWSLDVTIPTSEPLVVPRLEIGYIWNDAVLLTHDDVDLIDLQQATYPRAQGRECVVALASTALTSLTLSVSFPASSIPEPAHVLVLSHSLTGNPNWEVEHTLREQTHFAGPTITLLVSYPIKDRAYVIAWRPPPSPKPAITAHRVWNHPQRGQLGDRIAQAALDAFANIPWQDRVGVAVYVPDNMAKTGYRQFRRIGATVRAADLTRLVDMKGEAAQFHRTAWWDEVVVQRDDLEDQAAQPDRYGMAEDESLVAYLPLRAANELGPPVGILRIGLRTAQPPTIDPDMPDLFSTKLAQAHARAIHLIMQELH